MRHVTIRTPKLLVALAVLVGTSIASATTIVERIEVESPTVVRFHLSGPTEGRVVGLPPRLPVKGRIVADFNDARLGPDAQEPVPGTGVIVRVRPEQIKNKDMVRATIELTRGVGFQVEKTDKTVTVRLEVAAAPPTATPPPAESSAQRPAP